MPPLFSFRLNSSIVPMVFIKRERVKEKITGRLDVMCPVDQPVYPLIVISLDRKHFLVAFGPHDPKISHELHVGRMR